MILTNLKNCLFNYLGNSYYIFLYNMNYDILNNDTVKGIIKKFIRKCPKDKAYFERLVYEFNVIINKNFYNYILQVHELLQLVKDIPFIIRGSAGSSLVCYCLGITNIDPVKYDINFSRFLNETRESMPDIDFDFPYNRRDEVFEKINKHWEDKVARISNHVMFKEKSATREAIRQTMIKNLGESKFIPKAKCNSKSFPEWKDEIETTKKKLLGNMRCYSLHCGGIVIYKDKVPDDIKLLNTKTENQIKYNKEDVADNGLFKIDILSNRGLAQLFDVSDTPIEEYPELDSKITKMLEKGNNIGLTFSESPAMKKLLVMTKPKNINDIAFCLALVRPAAADGAKSKAIAAFGRGEFGDFIIFDDDAIDFIKNSIECDEGMADKYRRAFSKNKKGLIGEFDKLLEQFNYNSDKKDKLNNSLYSLRKYSFCKSHAISYAKLVWALAYHKAHNPIEFWVSTLNHSHSSYRKWVHYCEAKAVGIELAAGEKPYKIKNNKLISLGKKHKNIDDPILQFKNYGFWVIKEFLPNMYMNIFDDDIPLPENKFTVKFRGLIAIGRINNKYDFMSKSKNCSTFVTIGYDNAKYVDLIFDNAVYFYNYDIIEGEGILESYTDKVKFNNNTNRIIVSKYKLVNL